MWGDMHAVKGIGFSDGRRGSRSYYSERYLAIASGEVRYVAPRFRPIDPKRYVVLFGEKPESSPIGKGGVRGRAPVNDGDQRQRIVDANGRRAVPDRYA